MTPAINCAKKAKIEYTLHQYDHDSSNASYGPEAAEKLGVLPERVFKTLVVKLDATQLVVAILPVNSMLSMKNVVKACGGRKAEMADKVEVQRSSGYVLGGVSPLGQKKSLKTVIDQSAQQYPTIYVSGGRRGLEIELNALDLQTLTLATFAPLSQ
ncbi:Cys-tRNA(Pro) deacylase [Paraglaciecola sp. MB-3u-78]|jgi:Cys-tRNA(Pro)/Cys-tRNA(Cys) deacylase|uniref:Cys-tRNA(Pro) deacylase n=1 Tax=Paraglaciecola sp. MB-3u-78 TaxID=2058332 RepID=UPI000C338675|nr:Cys-tRNA(Pro) deacylase [Paraglaciecola sp. MB-3u-78]PKG93369.1 Cys-tRNA(Pro) deacylase [Paraglaciecola sp. MB-3u-78]